MRCYWDKCFWSGVLLCFTVFQTTAGLSAPEDFFQKEDYRKESYRGKVRQGARSFSQGNYEQAKAYFEQALMLSRQPEEPTASMNYNLGSVCFKLRQYEESKKYFSRLLDSSKLKAVAYYNLALIENKQGNRLRAKNFLAKSKAASKDEKFTVLVERQLEKLSSVKTATLTPRKISNITIKDWQAYLYLRSGYDSNIKFSPLEIASEQSGRYLQSIGLFDKVIAGKGFGSRTPVLMFTSSFFVSNYHSTDFNDYNLFDIGLRYLHPVNQWRNSIDINIKKSTYGHNDYQRTVATTFKTKYLFSDGDIFRLRYRYEDISSLDSLYDYLSGSRHRLRVGYSFKWPDDAVLLWQEFEQNDRQNTARRNYSPVRSTSRLRYEKKMLAKHKAYVELEYRRSDYAATAFQDRLDSRASYTLAYLYDITPEWQLEAHWRFQNNRSTESIYSYDRHIAYLNVRKTF